MAFKKSMLELCKKHIFFNKNLIFWSAKYTILSQLTRKFIHIFPFISISILQSFIGVTKLIIEL